MTPLPPFAKLARAVNTSTLVLTHFPHLTDNSRLLLVGASQFCWCYLSSYQQPTGWSKVTAVSSRMSQQQCTSQFCGGQGEQSADHSLQGHVPVAVEADLSPSPAASILNSLSGWNIQEALEEWIIHSLVLLPMDLCFLVPMRHSVFVLTVIGDVCASFDGSWGHAISSICSTRSNSTIHHSACQTRLSSEALRAASLTKRLDSFQGSVQQQQPSREAADTCFVITLQHWPEPYCSAVTCFDQLKPHVRLHNQQHKHTQSPRQQLTPHHERCHSSACCFPPAADLVSLVIERWQWDPWGRGQAEGGRCYASLHVEVVHNENSKRAPSQIEHCAQPTVKPHPPHRKQDYSLNCKPYQSTST